MKEPGYISPSVIRRLPRYYRFLSDLQAAGAERISSKELSERMGLTASQIRQDFNCFGGFGQQGYGYNIEQLRAEIAGILGLARACKTILVGAGNLGRAIASHMPFRELGFDLVGIFDSDKLFAGLKIKSLPIRPTAELTEFCKENRPETAILCIPDVGAKEVVEKLIRCGITSFWNFTQYDINSDYPSVKAESIQLSDSLMTLSYLINNRH